MTAAQLKKFSRAPFPYFRGQNTVADLVWSRFGAVKQYIEPLAGSAADPRQADLRLGEDDRPRSDLVLARVRAERER